MKFFKKRWVQFIIIALLMLPIAVGIQQIISTEEPITQLQTWIFIYQLLFGSALGLGAWLLAGKQIDLMEDQISLSKEQGKIVDKQAVLMERQMELALYMYNVENARYNVDKLTDNLDTNLLQFIAGSITKYLDKDEEAVRHVTKLLKGVDTGIGKVNKTLDDALEEYKNTRNNSPKWIKFE